MSTRDETELIAAVRQGDSSAMAELFELYRPRIAGVVERQMSAALKQKLDPEDIVQEVMLSCLQALPHLDTAQLVPFDWICQMVRRRVIDAARRYSSAEKRAVQREVSLAAGGASSARGLVDLLVASMTTPSAAFSRLQREFRVSQALEQLGEESRMALRLRYVEALPSKEIAQRLNKSDGAVRVLLTRALQRLQKILEEPVEPQE